MIRSRLTACIARWGLVLSVAGGTRAVAAPSDAAREFADALPPGAVVVTAPGSGARLSLFHRLARIYRALSAHRGL